MMRPLFCRNITTGDGTRHAVVQSSRPRRDGRNRLRQFLQRLWRLEDHVVGINRRNLQLVGPLNPQYRLSRAKDKLITKELLVRHHLPVPRTVAVFERFSDIAGLEAALEPLDGFAIKPARGLGGRGILIVRRRSTGQWHQVGAASGRSIGQDAVQSQAAAILSGVYSNDCLSDRGFVEELIEPLPLPSGLSALGLPDLRLLVLQGRPIMAMLRLPTRQSDGRANLHQGAIGVGVDVATGRTTHAIVGHRTITTHPDTAEPLASIRIPYWRSVVRLATAASQAAKLGYLGVDIVLARSRGPLILEINSRPGLNIQLANRTGLIPSASHKLCR